MDTITISKKMLKNHDLVLVPKKEFERISKIANLVSEDQLWFWSREWQEKKRGRRRY